VLNKTHCLWEGARAKYSLSRDVVIFSREEEGAAMKCTEIHSLLYRKIDGELPDFEQRELDAHLAQCVYCNREYRLLTFPQRILRTMPGMTVSPSFCMKLRTRIEMEAREAAGRQMLMGLARQMIPALAGITLALLSVFAYLQLHSPEGDLCRAYSKAFISGDSPHQLMIAGQGDITNEGILSAVAEREFDHRRNLDPK
jgi:hypothetical protein